MAGSKFAHVRTKESKEPQEVFPEGATAAPFSVVRQLGGCFEAPRSFGARNHPDVENSFDT